MLDLVTCLLWVGTLSWRAREERCWCRIGWISVRRTRWTSLSSSQPGAASQQINLGGGGRGCWVRLASPWRSCRPQTLSLAGFHSSSGWQLPPRAPVGPETRGERATTVGVLAAERGQALRLLLALAQVRMGRSEEREDERMTTSSSKSSHSRMQDFTLCLLLFVIAFCFETRAITDRERESLERIQK